MPETPNHGYNVPDEGEEDWHEPLNENFERYDTDIEIRDEAANRSDYEPKAGAKFLATDTGVVYLGTGQEWKYVAGTGDRPVVTYTDVRFEEESRQPGLRYWWDNDGASDQVAGHDYSASTHTWRFRITGTQDTPGTGYLTFNADNQFGLGQFAPEATVDIKGGNRWDLAATEGDLRIGNSDYRLKAGVALGGGGAGIARIRSHGGANRLILGGGENDVLDVGTDGVTVQGDLDVNGNKNFVQSVDTDAGEREVVYTATEAGTPHTEASGVAELEDGRAVVDLPDHFGWVTDADEPLHVQTTPYAAESGGLAVVERSTGRVVVEDLDGEGDYEFAYTVKGTREGHAEKRVVREPSATATDGPAPADD